MPPKPKRSLGPSYATPTGLIPKNRSGIGDIEHHLRKLQENSIISIPWNMFG